jgi:hypothetical protein
MTFMYGFDRRDDSPDTYIYEVIVDGTSNVIASGPQTGTESVKCASNCLNVSGGDMVQFRCYSDRTEDKCRLDHIQFWGILPSECEDLSDWTMPSDSIWEGNPLVGKTCAELEAYVTTDQQSQFCEFLSQGIFKGPCASEAVSISTIVCDNDLKSLLIHCISFCQSTIVLLLRRRRATDRATLREHGMESA